MTPTSPGTARDSSGTRRRVLPPTTTRRSRRPRSLPRLRFAAAVVGALVSLLVIGPGAALAAPAAEGWGSWWLPDDYSEHGHQMDLLFNVIFWVTMVTLVAVWAVLIYFCVKYRHRPEKRKAVFSHGNTKLEMIWTLVPAVILIVLALVTKSVWDNYRYSPTAKSPDLARILVIGQQFKWNVIYPGPDGKLGRYLMYPKVTDLKWPVVPPGDAYEFPNVPGPAFLTTAQAKSALEKYVEAVNPLGKDFSDPDGADDDWVKTPGREINVPKGRPVEVHLSSRDVIHDFFLPNFRVKLDAVPGLRGHVYFTATKSSAELEQASRKKYNLDALRPVLAAGGANPPEYRLVVDLTHPQAEAADAPGNTLGAPRYWEMVKEKKRKRVRGKLQEVEEEVKKTLAAQDAVMSVALVDELKGKGFTEVNAYRPAFFDLVCEELCGGEHYSMQGRLFVLEQDVYRKMFETPKGGTPDPATTQPAAPVARAAADDEVRAKAGRDKG